MPIPSRPLTDDTPLLILDDGVIIARCTWAAFLETASNIAYPANGRDAIIEAQPKLLAIRPGESIPVARMSASGPFRALMVFRDDVTDADVADMADDALHAAALSIQDRLGVTDGGWASVVFSDDVVEGLLADYARSEIAQVAESDEAEGWPKGHAPIAAGWLLDRSSRDAEKDDGVTGAVSPDEEILNVRAYPTEPHTKRLAETVRAFLDGTHESPEEGLEAL